MGYYGLLFPGTALAKDASGAKWSQGFVYLANFNQPVSAVGARDPAGRPWPRWCWSPVAGRGGSAAPLRPATAGWRARCKALPRWWYSCLSAVCCRRIYWIRQGGDFMHGRVLLTPLFCLLAPVAVIPMVLPDGARMPRGAGYLFAGATSVLWLAVARLVAVGGEFARHGVRRHPRHVHRHRRRAPVLRAGHRQRASVDGRRLSRLPANAGGADRAEQHARRRAAVAVRQLRPVGRGARRPAAAGCARRRAKDQRARTQCFSPISACWA